MRFDPLPPVCIQERLRTRRAWVLDEAPGEQRLRGSGELTTDDDVSPPDNITVYNTIADNDATADNTHRRRDALRPARASGSATRASPAGWRGSGAPICASAWKGFVRSAVSGDTAGRPCLELLQAARDAGTSAGEELMARVAGPSWSCCPPRSANATSAKP